MHLPAQALADAVASISAERIALRVNDPLKPAVIRAPEDAARNGEDQHDDGAAGSGGDDAGEPAGGHLALIMPMRNPDK